MRFGGQYVAKTGPIRLARGDRPPDAGIAGVRAVVADHQVLALVQRPALARVRGVAVVRVGSSSRLPLA